MFYQASPVRLELRHLIHEVVNNKVKTIKFIEELSKSDPSFEAMYKQVTEEKLVSPLRSKRIPYLFAKGDRAIISPMGSDDCKSCAERNLEGIETILKLDDDVNTSSDEEEDESKLEIWPIPDDACSKHLEREINLLMDMRKATRQRKLIYKEDKENPKTQMAKSEETTNEGKNSALKLDKIREEYAEKYEGCMKLEEELIIEVTKIISDAMRLEDGKTSDGKDPLLTALNSVGKAAVQDSVEVSTCGKTTILNIKMEIVAVLAMEENESSSSTNEGEEQTTTSTNEGEERTKTESIKEVEESS